MKQKKKKPKKPEGNFGKVPFQKMPLDSMIGSKAKKANQKPGVFTSKRG